jgi:hypothetical protein
MKPVDLAEQRAEFSGTRFCEIVQYELRRRSQSERTQGVLWTVAALPEAARTFVEGFIDRWNTRAYDRGFWQRDTGDVFDEIIDDARIVLRPLGLAADDEAAFNFFSIVVLNYAHSAYDQPEMREFLGIARASEPASATRCLELAGTAHRLLGTYAAIHDNIFAAPWYRAIRRIVPIPGIFDRIPYPEHRDALKTVSAELRDVRDEAKAVATSGALSSAEANLCRSLQLYCDALRDSVDRLREICLDLGSKADGQPGPTWSEYQRKLGAYQDSCSRYMPAGEGLNVALDRVNRGA